MITILKINSADIINEVQTDTLALCIIPSNSIKYKLSQLPIMKELINQPVDVIEEPDPIDPADYIFIDDVPEFFWNFIKYALTKPEKISPENFVALSRLLQNNKSTVFNWADNNYSLTNSEPGYPIRKITTESYNGYIFNSYSSLISEKTITPRAHNITIQAEVELLYLNQTQSIAIYQPSTNYLHPNSWIRLIKTGYKNFQVAMRTSTVSGSNFAVNLDLSYTGGNVGEIAYHPITLTAIMSPNNSTSIEWVTLKADYYLSRNGEVATESIIGYGNLKSVPEEVNERIGAYKQYNPSAAGYMAVPAVRKYRKYKTTIQNIDTKISEVVTYIDFDKSKIIDDKLLMIV